MKKRADRCPEYTEKIMKELSEYMMKLGEPLAAGMLEYPDGPIERTYCRGYRRYYESCPIVYKPGAPLFPAGLTDDELIRSVDTPEGKKPYDLAVFPHYAHQYKVDWERLRKKDAHAEEIMRDFSAKYRYVGYWNHSVLNYGRILSEGIDGYEARLLKKGKSDFCDALLDLIEGIRIYHRRALEALPGMGAPKALTDALRRVPFAPARTAYEAIVSYNFCLSLDGWDNAGRIDAILAPYHKGEDMREWIRCLMESMKENDRWSLTIGPEYNGITRQVLECSVGLSRPLIELRLTKDCPEDVWRLALGRILRGDAQPSFYNDCAIRERLRERIPDLRDGDDMEFAGGGCTETNLAGYTYAGGTDQTINVLKIFDDYMRDNLATADDFESFYRGFKMHLRKKQDEQMADINAYWNERAIRCFAPIRTLFVDDCIDRELGWMQGGARYSYAVQGDMGIPNTVDSLLAVKNLIFENKRYSPDRFIELLEAEDEGLLRDIRLLPAYGRGDDEADMLMKDFTSEFYAHYKTGKLDLGIGYLPTAHQFTRHITAGEEVGATPDGRRAHTPTADSIAAVNGKAVNGPTAMLKSAASYEQKDIYGIAVANLSISPSCKPEALRALIEGYFELGGTQLQITAVDREALLDAKKNPDAHRDLIVRVGGYSDYFCRLRPNVQDAVIERTMFEV